MANSSAAGASIDAQASDYGQPPRKSSRRTVQLRLAGRPAELALADLSTLEEVAFAARPGGHPRLDRSQAQLLRAIAEAFGKKVEFYEPEPSLAVGDGFVRPGDGSTIYLSLASSVSPMAAFGHELMHLLERDQPQAYAAVRSVVERQLRPGAIDEMVALGYERRQAIHELVADLAGDAMADSRFWGDVFEQVQDRRTVAALVSTVRNVVSNVLQSLRLLGFGSHRYVDDLQEVRTAVRDGVALYIQAQAAEALREGDPTSRPAGAESAFGRWFAASKAVDLQGRPLVMYHGTKSDVERFDLKKAGVSDDGLAGRAIYLTYNPEEASGYALKAQFGQGDAPNVMPVHVVVRNPLVITQGALPDGRTLRDLHQGGSVTSAGGKALRNLTEGGGHDGVMWVSRAGEVRHVAAFKPEQVKSATGNSGAFDPRKADITRSRTRSAVAEAPLEVEIRQHSAWSVYTERSFLLGDGYARWVEDGDSVYVTDLQAGPRTRGQALLEQIARVTDKETSAVGVVPEAQGFWDRMEEEGVIASQTKTPYRQFFGLDPVRLADQDDQQEQADSEDPDDAEELRHGRGADGGQPAQLEGPLPGTPESEAALRRAAAFAGWFGNSQVRRADGSPLVVYHGTNQPFNVFDPKRLGESTRTVSAYGGFFFTSDAVVASAYADFAGSRVISDLNKHEAKTRRLLAAMERAERAGRWDETERLTDELERHELDAIREGNVGANVLPVYLSMQRPMTIEAHGSASSGEVMEWIEKASRAGHYGLIVRQISDAPIPGLSESDHYIAFSPTQIKSATGNCGRYDRNNADITQSRTRPSESPATAVLSDISARGALAVLGEKLHPLLDLIARGRPLEVSRVAQRRGYVSAETAAAGGPVLARAMARLDDTTRRECAERVLGFMATRTPQIGFVRQACAAVRSHIDPWLPSGEGFSPNEEGTLGALRAAAAWQLRDLVPGPVETEDEDAAPPEQIRG